MAQDPTRSPEALLADRVSSELKTILSEYGEAFSEDVIVREMEGCVSAFNEARIKDFVPLLAGRLARRRLKQLSHVG